MVPNLKLSVTHRAAMLGTEGGHFHYAVQEKKESRTTHFCQSFAALLGDDAHMMSAKFWDFLTPPPLVTVPFKQLINPVVTFWANPSPPTLSADVIFGWSLVHCGDKKLPARIYAARPQMTFPRSSELSEHFRPPPDPVSDGVLEVVNAMSNASQFKCSVKVTFEHPLMNSSSWDYC